MGQAQVRLRVPTLMFTYIQLHSSMTHFVVGTTNLLSVKPSNTTEPQQVNKCHLKPQFHFIIASDLLLYSVIFAGQVVSFSHIKMTIFSHVNSSCFAVFDNTRHLENIRFCGSHWIAIL